MRSPGRVLAELVRAGTGPTSSPSPHLGRVAPTLPPCCPPTTGGPPLAAAGSGARTARLARRLSPQPPLVLADGHALRQPTADAGPRRRDASAPARALRTRDGTLSALVAPGRGGNLGVCQRGPGVGDILCTRSRPDVAGVFSQRRRNFGQVFGAALRTYANPFRARSVDTTRPNLARIGPNSARIPCKAKRLDIPESGQERRGLEQRILSYHHSASHESARLCDRRQAKLCSEVSFICALCTGVERMAPWRTRGTKARQRDAPHWVGRLPCCPWLQQR